MADPRRRAFASVLPKPFEDAESKQAARDKETMNASLAASASSKRSKKKQQDSKKAQEAAKAAASTQDEPTLPNGIVIEADAQTLIRMCVYKLTEEYVSVQGEAGTDSKHDSAAKQSKKTSQVWAECV
jgi:hypothetical protein